MNRTTAIAVTVTAFAANALLSMPANAATKSVTFPSGAKCDKPAGFNLGEWKALQHMVGMIEKIERTQNVSNLKMAKADFDSGKRFLRVEFDCASLTNLKPQGDKGRKKEILALLGNEARDPAMIANSMDARDEFKEAIKKLVIGSHKSDKDRDMRVTIKDGVLSISRVTFQGGGWTPGDWKKFFENNL